MLNTQTEPWHVLETHEESMIDQICQFRVQVWREEGQLEQNAFANGRWRDPVDSQATHWLIRDSQGQLAAAGRLSMHAKLAEVHEAHEYIRLGLTCTGPVASPDRVVVAGFARRCGLGKQILDLQDSAAVAHGASHAVRQASPRMVQLLLNRGWEILGPASPDARFPGVQFQVIVKCF